MIVLFPSPYGIKMFKLGEEKCVYAEIHPQNVVFAIFDKSNVIATYFLITKYSIPKNEFENAAYLDNQEPHNPKNLLV